MIALEDYVRTFFSFNLSTKADLSHNSLLNSAVIENESTDTNPNITGAESTEEQKKNKK